MNNKITPKSKILIDFIDLPENNTTKNQREIKNKVAKTFGVDKNSITVNFIAAKQNEHGKLIEIEGANIENILDNNYQEQLFKEWLSREKIDMDFDKILAYDTIINNDLNGEFDKSIYNRWSLDWIEISNFLSYGPGKNRIQIKDLDGLTIVSSNPPNFGGKTTALIDSILFLTMGVTTKTQKNEEVFNKFSDDDTLYVKGKLVLGGEDIIIERSLSRKLKKDGTWNVNANLKYKKILADGEIVDMKEEDSIKTTAEIKKLVGTESTFNLTILATGNNLNDLITLKPTENSAIINKLIGLEVIEAKERIARDRLNEFNKTRLSNILKPAVLEEEISSAKDIIEILESNIAKGNEEMVNLELDLKTARDKKDSLAKEYVKIEVDINTVSKDKIISDLSELESTGLSLKSTFDELTKEYVETYENIVYDDVKYNELVKEFNRLTSDLALCSSSVKFETERLETVNKDDGKCYACGAISKEALKAIDATRKEITEKLVILNKTKDDIDEQLTDVDAQISVLREQEKLFNEKNKMELQLNRLLLNIRETRVKYKERKRDLSFYETNESAITKNKEVDLEIGVLNTEIKIKENRINDVRYKLNESDKTLSLNRKIVSDNEDSLIKIEEQSKEHRLYSTYVDMVGKKGINKLVVRSLIPVINNELNRILDGTVDFKLEVSISDKNDIEYNIVNGDIRKLAKSGSGYEKTLSSLALRCVLAKISHLPMPNFIVFDEILGQVSPENYGLIEIFFNRIKGMFDTVFFISHDERTQDWGDNTLLVEKVNNLSSIS